MTNPKIPGVLSKNNALNTAPLFGFFWKSPICEIVKGKILTTGCVTCMNENFLLNSLDNKEIVRESFYSTFNCKCQIASNYSHTAVILLAGAGRINESDNVIDIFYSNQILNVTRTMIFITMVLVIRVSKTTKFLVFGTLTYMFLLGKL